MSVFKPIRLSELEKMKFPPGPFETDPTRDPVRLWTGEVVTFEEAVDLNEKHSGQRLQWVLYRKGNWVLTDYGVESLSHPWYFIEMDRIFEPEWVRHIAQKGWDMEDPLDFALVLEVARELALRPKREPTR